MTKGLTPDLHAALLWDMKFSWPQCNMLHFGTGQAPNLAVEDEQGRCVLELVNFIEDLGAIPNPDMKHPEQGDTPLEKARSAA